MPKRNTLLVLVGIFLVLLVLALFGGRDEPRSLDETLGRVLPEFEAEAAARIVIEAPSGAATLARSDDGWVVTSEDDFPADADAVTTALDRLGEMERTGIASRNLDKLPLFEVDEEKGVHVEVQDATGATLADLWIGKAGADFGSSYVRVAGDDEVIQVAGFLRGVFDRGTRGWKDRKLLDFAPDRVARVRVADGDREVVIERRPAEDVDEETETSAEEMEEDPAVEPPDVAKLGDVEAPDHRWHVVTPAAADAEADTTQADRIVTVLSNLAADGFAPDKTPAEAGLEPPQASVTVVLEDGSELRLLVGEPTEDNKTHVSVAGREMIYLLYSSRVDNVVSTVTGFAGETES